MNMTKFLLFLISLLFTLNCFGQTTTVSFEYYQKLIFFRMKVNNTDSLFFLFDTGANASAIDTKVSDKLNLKTAKNDTVEGTAGIINVPFVKAKTLSVGNSVVKNIYFTKYDLSGSLAPPNQYLAGIVGTDFLKHFVVTIDFQNKQISFSKKNRDKLTNTIPLELDNGIPGIKSSINDSITTFFRYDSGSSLFETNDIYLNTSTSIFEKILFSDSTLKPVRFLSASGVGGSIKLPVYKINSVLLGNIEVKHPFLIIQPKQGYFARTDAVGFFGNNLFEKFHKVTIDFINKYICTKKPEINVL